MNEETRRLSRFLTFILPLPQSNQPNKCCTFKACIAAAQDTTGGRALVGGGVGDGDMITSCVLSFVLSAAIAKPESACGGRWRAQNDVFAGVRRGGVVPTTPLIFIFLGGERRGDAPPLAQNLRRVSLFGGPSFPVAAATASLSSRCMQRSRVTVRVRVRVRVGRGRARGHVAPREPNPVDRPPPPTPQALAITAACAAAVATVAVPTLTAPPPATPPPAPGFRKGGARAAVHARAAEHRRERLGGWGGGVDDTGRETLTTRGEA